MVWIPKEPKYKPKPPKPNNTPINTPSNTPTDVLEGGNKMTNQEAIKKLRVLKFKYPIKRESTFDIALDMAIDALKREPIVIRCKELLSKEDFEAVVKRIHEQNQNVIVIPCEVEVVSTNTPTKSTSISTDVSEDGNEMTREEAIKYLEQHKHSNPCGRKVLEESNEAIDMAIEALKEHKSDGNWIDENDSYYAHCSRCGYQIDTHIERGYLNYCPNCGKYMLGGENK